MNWLIEKWQDFKAWRRGEHRIAKGRGRVYAKKDGSREEIEPARKMPTATITAKVIRADGSIEIHEAATVTIFCDTCGDYADPPWFDEEGPRCRGCMRPSEYCNCEAINGNGNHDSRT